MSDLKWADEMCRAFAYAYDGEDAAQMGEPNPWDADEADATWEAERIACVRAALGAAVLAWIKANADDLRKREGRECRK